MPALLAKGLTSFLPPPPPRHSLRQTHLPLLTSPLRIALSAALPKRRDNLPFIADYLVKSFRFSSRRALKLSADPHLAGITSLDKPESVVGFLRDIGLSDSQIKTCITSDPLVLSYCVKKDLKPWVRELKANGCSKEVLVLLIQSNPRAFALKDAVMRFLFWREFVHNDHEVLLKVFRKNRFLFHCDIQEYVVPRFNLFRRYGLSNQQIVSLLRRDCQLMFRNLDNLQWVLEKTQELGIHHGSTMFLEGIIVVGSFSEVKLNRKIEFFKKSGWSEDEVLTAFRKFPRTLKYAEGRIRSHMDFLVRKAGLDLRSIALDPLLLGFSMEKRLVPRHHVLTMLKARGLKKSYKLHSACLLSDEKFLEKLVLPHEKDVPGLLEAYAGAWTGEVAL